MHMYCKLGNIPMYPGYLRGSIRLIAMPCVVSGEQYVMTRLSNDTWIATLLSRYNNWTLNLDTDQQSVDKMNYDEKGAMYFIVIVITFYAIGIILMIVSLTRSKSRSEDQTDVDQFIKTMTCKGIRDLGKKSFTIRENRYVCEKYLF